jgi:ribosomal-protein-alanine N-acetyltransferase
MRTVHTHLRWMIRADLHTLVPIDAASHPDPWDYDKITSELRHNNVIGMTAEMDGDPVGYALYRLDRCHIEILRIAVAPALRRCGIGSQMTAKLMSKVNAHRRCWLSMRVRETNIAGQRFLLSRGFVVLGILREFYGSEDGIVWQCEK